MITFTTLATTALATAAVGAAAFAGAGTASALTADDATFLTNIGDAGIVYDAPVDAIDSAYYVCDSLAGGDTVGTLGAEILSDTNLSTHQAAVFIVESVNTYCPELSETLSA